MDIKNRIRVKHLHIFSPLYKRLHGSEKEMRVKTGVSIIIKRQLARYVKNWEQVDKRLLQVEMMLKGYDVTIIGLYTHIRRYAQ